MLSGWASEDRGLFRPLLATIVSASFPDKSKKWSRIQGFFPGVRREVEQWLAPEHCGAYGLGLCSLTWPVGVGPRSPGTQVTRCAQFCRPPLPEEPTEDPLHPVSGPMVAPCFSSDFPASLGPLLRTWIPSYSASWRPVTAEGLAAT